MYLCMRDRSFNWRPGFWISAVTCFWKFSLISISMPNNVTEFSESILCFFFKFPSLLIIIDWNLSAFITISFERNESMAFSDSFWRSVINSSTLFKKVAIVLSSVKLRSCASFMKQKQNGSFKKNVEEQLS